MTDAHSPSELAAFYEESYARGAQAGERPARWRALGARGKADHVQALLERASLAPAAVLDIGCGDGSLLAELQRRGIGVRREGAEISERAAEIARSRPGVEAVAVFDGARLPAGDGDFDLGVLSHVLEHVPDPGALLGEAARACRAVIVEVPLEDNLSARRPSKRQGYEEIGHLQRFSRADVHGLIRDCGLRLRAELSDPLPLSVHGFFADSAPARARALAKWGIRRSLHRLSAPVARRAFTVHYAALAVRDADA